MQEALSLIAQNHQSKAPPDDGEIGLLTEALKTSDALDSATIPSQLEGCLAFLCTRYANKSIECKDQSNLKLLISWLTKCCLLGISFSGVEPSYDAFYGLRSLLTRRAIPYKLTELELRKLVASAGETNEPTAPTSSTAIESPKKKVKKAQVAKELWDDISSAISDINVENPSQSPSSSSSMARTVFWTEHGQEVLLSCLQSILKLLQKDASDADLESVTKKGYLCCQIIEGAISDPCYPNATLASLPTMFVNNWIKTVFKMKIAVIQALIPSLFSRTVPQTQPDFAATGAVFDNLVILQESFFSLFDMAGKSSVACFERDAAHLWFNLCLLAAYCHSAKAESVPLTLHSPTPVNFVKFTALALHSLGVELMGPSAANSAASVLFNRAPWSPGSSDASGEVPASISTSSTTAPIMGPLEWNKELLDAYERFILEADFRQSLVLCGPLDLHLLDIATAFLASSKSDDSNSEVSSASIRCAKNALLALCSLLQQRRAQNTTAGTTGDQEAFVSRLLHLLNQLGNYDAQSLPQDLSRPLTAFFCLLAQTPVAPATLTRFHLLPPDPELCLAPSGASFRLLATHLLGSASGANSAAVEAFCLAAVRHSPTPDIPAHMAQLISLLSAAFPTHSAKKALLNAIVDTLMDLNDASPRALRLLALLRYQLHHIFDPPRHLNDQVRPAILGLSVESRDLVTEFPNLAGRGPSPGYFYDLLSKGKTALPPRDGLAIMSLVARADYDRVFRGLLGLCDSWWMAVDGGMLWAAYGEQLAWRLLEILPPSPGFVERLHKQVNGDEVGDEEEEEESDADGGRHRLFYLLVLLDRLRRLPTSMLPGAGTEKESKRGKHGIEAMANETFKAQTARLASINSRQTDTEAAACLPASPLSSPQAYESFLSRLRGYRCHLPLLLYETRRQLSHLQASLSVTALPPTDLLLSRVLLHLVRTLVSRLDSSKATLRTPGEAEDEDYEVKKETSALGTTSTGSQSPDTVVWVRKGSKMEAEAKKKSKKCKLLAVNAQLRSYLDVVTTLTLDITETCFGRLAEAAGLGSGILATLCPQQLTSSTTAEMRESSILLARPATTRLAKALRAPAELEEEVDSDGERSRLRAWRSTMEKADDFLNWPVSETETLSQVVNRRLTSAPVNLTDSPVALLYSGLLKESLELLETLASQQVIAGASSSKRHPLATRRLVPLLAAIHLSPLCSPLKLDTTTATLLRFLSTSAAAVEARKQELPATTPLSSVAAKIGSIALERHVVHAVLRAAIEGVEEPGLRREVFAYLEVALGLRKVLKWVLKEEAERAEERKATKKELLLASLPGSGGLSKEYMRLLVVVLFRAINPPMLPPIYISAAVQMIDALLAAGHLTTAVQDLLSDANPREAEYRRLFERLLRLLAAAVGTQGRPWRPLRDRRVRLLNTLLSAMETTAPDRCPLRGHCLVSGVRSLLLQPLKGTAKTKAEMVAGHVRLAEVLNKWVQAAKQLQDEMKAEDKDEFIRTLCSAYDYFALLLRALTTPDAVTIKPSTAEECDDGGEKDDKEEEEGEEEEEETTATTSALILPDPRYLARRNHGILSQNLLPPPLARFFAFLTNTDAAAMANASQMHPGEAWNSSLDATILYGLCGPPNHHHHHLDGPLTPPKVLSVLPTRISPLEVLCEEACTFAASGYSYIRQPWYTCTACGMVNNHGACHRCARVCHGGRRVKGGKRNSHNARYENTSEFFCDCAAESGERCRGFTRCLVRDGGLMASLLPWMNTTCFNRQVYDSICELVNLAAKRQRRGADPAIIAPPASGSFASFSNSNNAVSAAAPALPPRAVTLRPAAAVESETPSASRDSSSGVRRLRRMGAFRGIRVSNDGSSSSSHGNASAAAAAAVAAAENKKLGSPAVKLTPCLSVLLGEKRPTVGGDVAAASAQKEKTSISEEMAVRLRLLEEFLGKYCSEDDGQRGLGRRLMPREDAVVDRLRTMLAELKKPERARLLATLQSPDLLSVARRLLSSQLTSSRTSSSSSSLNAALSFGEVFQKFDEPALKRAQALDSLTETTRTTCLKVETSSSLVTPVRFTLGSEKASRKPLPTVNENPPASAPPTMSTSSQSHTDTPSGTTSVSASLIPSYGENLRMIAQGGRSMEALLRQICPDYASPALASLTTRTRSFENDPLGLQRRPFNRSSHAAALTRIPSVGGWRHYLLATTANDKPSCINVYSLDDVFSTAARCVEVGEEEQTSGSSAPPLVVKLADLPVVGRVNCKEVLAAGGGSIAVHPENGSLVVVAGSKTCNVLAFSPLGQVVGRVAVAPVRTETREQEQRLLKTFWLPGSTRYLALLTTKSVQIFDIFTKVPKLMFYFIPVEGNFTDATFIHAPLKKTEEKEEGGGGGGGEGAESDNENGEGEADVDYAFSDVVLVVMAAFGSMMVQRLLPTTRMSQGHFYLAETLDWDVAGLCLSTAGEAAEAAPSDSSPLDGLRNTSQGTLGEGGVGVFFAPSLRLLLHSYAAGHTFASAIDLIRPFEPTGAGSAGLKVNHSFVITGGKASATARSGGKAAVLQAPVEGVTAWSGPLRDWAEVPGGSLPLLTASLRPDGGGSGSNLLVAVEAPHRVWIQSLPSEIVDPPTPTVARLDSATHFGTSNNAAVSTPVPTGTTPNPTTTTTPSNVFSALSHYWVGSDTLGARLFTLLLSEQGSLQVLAAPSDSIASTTPAPTSELLDSSKGVSQAASPGGLEDLLLWQVCDPSPWTKNAKALDGVTTITAGYEAKRMEFAAYALEALPALRTIVERSGDSFLGPETSEENRVDSSLALCDFHEWAKVNDNVNFYSQELLFIYNNEGLNMRLRHEAMPITYTGCPNPNEDGVDYGGIGNRRRQQTKRSNQGSLSKFPHPVAFTIDVSVTRPADDVIVGLRVVLADTNQPRFIAVFNRVYTIDGKARGGAGAVTTASSSEEKNSKTTVVAAAAAKSSTKYVDVALTLREILQLDSAEALAEPDLLPVRIHVGASHSPDMYTSIDRVLVYTVPRTHIDPSLLMLVNPDTTITSASPTITAEKTSESGSEKSSPRLNLKKFNPICLQLLQHNSHLVHWIDKLMATGFVARPPSLRSTHGPSEFLVPVYDCTGGSTDAAFVTSLTDFFQSALALKSAAVEPVLRDIEPCLTTAITQSLPEAFAHSRCPAVTSRVADLIRLWASCPTPNTKMESLTSPWAIMKELTGDFLSALTSTQLPESRLAASAVCLNHLARVWQLAHEYGDVAPPELTHRLFAAVQKILLSSPKAEKYDLVRVLQALCKIILFSLARDQQQQQEEEESVGAFAVELLTHCDSRIGRFTRDILCTALVTLFTGNGNISRHFFSPHPSKLDIEEEVEEENEEAEEEEISSESRRENELETSQPQNNANAEEAAAAAEEDEEKVEEEEEEEDDEEDDEDEEEGSLEAIGRNLNRMLHLLSTATAGGGGEEGEVALDPERWLSGSTARRARREYASLCQAMEEIRRTLGAHPLASSSANEGQQQQQQRSRSGRALYNEPGSISFMDEFEEELLQHQQRRRRLRLHAQRNANDDGDVANGGDEGGRGHQGSGEAGSSSASSDLFLMVAAAAAAAAANGSSENTSQARAEEETEATQRTQEEAAPGVEFTDEDDDGDSDEDITEGQETDSQPDDMDAAAAAAMVRMRRGNSASLASPVGNEGSDFLRYMVDMISAQTPEIAEGGVEMARNDANRGAPTSGDLIAHDPSAASLLFDPVFLESIDEDASAGDGGDDEGSEFDDDDDDDYDDADEFLLNLALQRSLQDQGGPGTAALIESQTSNEDTATQQIHTGSPRLTINASNSRSDNNAPATATTSGSSTTPPPAVPAQSTSGTTDTRPTTSIKSTVSTQMLPQNSSGNEVNREGSRVSTSSDLSEGFLSNLFQAPDEDDYDNGDEDEDGEAAAAAAAAEGNSEAMWDGYSLADSTTGDNIAYNSHLVSSESEGAFDDDDDNNVSRGRSRDGGNPSAMGGRTAPPNPPGGDDDAWGSGLEPRDRQSLHAARAAVALTRHLVAAWPGLVANPSLEARRCVPLMQTLAGMCRLLEAVAQLSTLPGARAEHATMSERAFSVLVDLVKALAQSLLVLDKIHSERARELRVFVANLLASVLTTQPKTASSNSATASATAQLVGETALGGAEGLFRPCMEVCLGAIQVLHSKWIGEGSGQEKKSSSPSPLPLLTLPVVQCALGLSHSSLTGSFGDTDGKCVGNLAPLLDAEASMRLLDASSDVQSAEAAARLATALFALFGEEMKKTKTTAPLAAPPLHSVIYDLLEVLNSPQAERRGELRSLDRTSAQRLVELLKSLLMQLVGAKHYDRLKDIHLLERTLKRMRAVYEEEASEQTQQSSTEAAGGSSDRPTTSSFYPTPLSYASECAMLNSINTCLDVALANRFAWQCLCVRRKQHFIFMLKASLRVRDLLALGLLSLVALAFNIESQEDSQASDQKASLWTARVQGGNKDCARLVAEVAAELLGEEPSGAFLVDFVRANVCCRADHRIRATAALVMSALVWNTGTDGDAFARVLCGLLPGLWQEMPSFALYAEAFTYLTTSVLKRRPLDKWPGGGEEFAQQVMSMLLSQLEALAEHPRREIYKAIVNELPTTLSCPSDPHQLPQSANATTPSNVGASNGGYLVSRSGARSSQPPKKVSTTPSVQAPSKSRGERQMGALHLPPNVLAFTPRLNCDAATSFPPCPMDSEACLLCNHPILDANPFAVYHWSSTSIARRRANSNSSTTPTTTNASGFSAAISASGHFAVDTGHHVEASPTSGFSLDPSVMEIEPAFCVAPNVHIFSLDEPAWQIGRIEVHFESPNLSAQVRGVRTVNIFTAEAFDALPSRLMQARHLWRRLVQVDLPLNKQKLCVHLTRFEGESLTATDKVDVYLSDGLPITANALIFHYAAFHDDEEYEVPGDSASGARPDVDIDGQEGSSGKPRSAPVRRLCARCRTVLVPGRKHCQACNQASNQCNRCLFINLSDEDDFLCIKCGHSNWNRMNFFVAARPAFGHIPRLCNAADRKAALDRIVACTRGLNSRLSAFRVEQEALFVVGEGVRWGRPEELAKAMNACKAALRSTLPLVWTLWNLRQAVALFDGRCSERRLDVLASQSGTGDERCLGCTQAAVWLLCDLVVSLKPSLLSEEARRVCLSRALPLMNSLSRPLQDQLMRCCEHLTANSEALIYHAGDLAVQRLTALAQCADEILDFEHACGPLLAMIRRGVQSVVAQKPPVGFDTNYACQEARLRVFFRLLLQLTSSSPPSSPSTAVREVLINHCMFLLKDLVGVGLAGKAETKRDSIKTTTTTTTTFRAPRANFEAWMRGDEAAAFAAWRLRYEAAEKLGTRASRIWRHICDSKPPQRRSLGLSARYTLRWLHRLSAKPPSSDWSSTATTESWLLPQLTTNAALAYRHVAYDQAQAASLLLHLAQADKARATDCLCYVVRHCLPHFASSILRPNRGSGEKTGVLDDEACLSGLIWHLVTGKNPENQLLKVTRREGSRRTNSEVFVPPSEEALEASIGDQAVAVRPLLLYRAKLLDFLENQLDRSLAELVALESRTRPLPQLLSWIDALPAQLSVVSGSGAAPGSNAALTVYHCVVLLQLLQPLNTLPAEYQDRVYGCLVRGIISLQSLVFQRSEFTKAAERLLRGMLKQLMTVASGARALDFIRMTMSQLTSLTSVGGSTGEDEGASVCLLLRLICECGCPLPPEVPPFSVQLSVWHDQEEYMILRRPREIIRSDTRELGSTVADALAYICSENNLTPTMPLEVVCDNSILMPHLRLEDVYQYLWALNPARAHKPMELTYRIQGLVTDNLPYITHLRHPEIPREVYSRLAILAPDGGDGGTQTCHLGSLLQCLGACVVRCGDALRCRDLLHVTVHLLDYCLKVPVCLSALLDPQYRAIPILLDALYACLQVMQDHNTQSSQSQAGGGSGSSEDTQFHDQVTSRLVAVLTTLLQPASNTVPIDTQGLPRLLTCVATHPDLEVVKSGVAKLPGLLVLGADDPATTASVVDFIRDNAVRPLFMKSPEEAGEARNDDLLQCCCAMVMAIPHATPEGKRLRAQLVQQLNLLELCVDYLWSRIPDEVVNITEETTLDKNDALVADFLSDTTIPYALRLLRGCVWSSEGDGADQVLPPPRFPSPPSSRSGSNLTTCHLLAFLHKLGDSKSVGQVGLLCEDLIEAWLSAAGTPASGSEADLSTVAGVAAALRYLRDQAVERRRKSARRYREKHLQALKMRVDDKGQVSLAADHKMAQLAAEVVEETGLMCAICHEGPRAAPRQELGIYVNLRKCRLDTVEELQEEGQETGRRVSVSGGGGGCEDGYASLSCFVVVHYTCHDHSVNALGQPEWEMAMRQNHDARCNAILPILMREPPDDEESQTPSMESVFGEKMENHKNAVLANVGLLMSASLDLQDIKLLLLRFAYQRPFQAELGGGARGTNLNFLPHLMQLALYHLRSEKAEQKELEGLMQMLDKPLSHWREAGCWDARGPLYGAVVALHLLPTAVWNTHRVRLLRHLLALAHARSTTTSVGSETPAPVPAITFSTYKPYLLFFGLVQGLYEHMFNNVKEPSSIEKKEEETRGWWPEALSQYIRQSDEQLLKSSSTLLEIFENDLLPVESLDEFLDVIGMLGEVEADELERIATTGASE